MGKFRGVVLPVLRLLVWTVIAVALCVIAFSGGSNTDDALTPEIGSSTSVVQVSTGDINSVIELPGTVHADPAIIVKATSAGRVSRVRVAKDDTVKERDPLFDVRVELPPANPSDPLAAPPPTRYTTKIVRATVPGTLSTLDVLVDQEVSVGTEVAKITPGTLTVVAPLTQAQQFRLLQPPASAQAQAPGGPAPFECVNVRSGAPDQVSDTSQNTGGGQFGEFGGSPEPSTAEVSCAVPAGTTVFAGMSVDLTLHTGSATSVLTLPVTAVQGTVGVGKVWVPGPDSGAPLERGVTLGLTDGQRVQIIDGLAEGDDVLEFAPVPDDDPASMPDGRPEGVYGG